MTMVLNIILILLSLALVLHPLRKNYDGYEATAWSGSGGSSGYTTETGEKDLLMNTLSEIEFDYQMKKLSEEDYHSLKNSYAKAALAILDKEGQT